MKHIHTSSIHTRIIPTLAFAMSIASTASAGITFTGLERSVSVTGDSSTNNDLFTHYNVSQSYDEDTGGIFIGASADANQDSLLDNTLRTLTFDGAASANGGAVSSASASTTLQLNFDITAGTPYELLIDGSLTEFDGSGIDPGSQGGSGTARITLSYNGSMIYSNNPTTNGTISVNDLLVLDTGTYELNIILSGSGPAQVGGGSGRADLIVEFIPTPGTATFALACGLISTRRRR
jgi:hypothetical protein